MNELMNKCMSVYAFAQVAGLYIPSVLFLSRLQVALAFIESTTASRCGRSLLQSQRHLRRRSAVLTLQVGADVQLHTGSQHDLLHIVCLFTCYDEATNHYLWTQAHCMRNLHAVLVVALTASCISLQRFGASGTPCWMTSRPCYCYLIDPAPKVLHNFSTSDYVCLQVCWMTLTPYPTCVSSTSAYSSILSRS